MRDHVLGDRKRTAVRALNISNVPGASPGVLVCATFSILSEIERLSAGCGRHRALVKDIDKSIIGSFYRTVTAHTAPMLRAIAGARVQSS